MGNLPWVGVLQLIPSLSHQPVRTPGIAGIAWKHNRVMNASPLFPLSHRRQAAAQEAKLSTSPLSPPYLPTLNIQLLWFWVEPDNFLLPADNIIHPYLRFN